MEVTDSKNSFTLSDKFVNYYKKKIIPEDVWNEFEDAIAKDLPVTFRISEIPELASEASALLDYFINDPSLQIERVSWKDNIYQVTPNKHMLKKLENYAAFREKLILLSDTGHISRQEIVSMLPPLLLDIKSHHKILDMCAAPGSKTMQLIELASKNILENDGFIIANDADKNRCSTLIHHLKKFSYPSLMVTNHDASSFPNLYINDQEIVKFDRILCDVPCSGDGTMRKNSGIFRRWNSGMGQSLHSLQFRILRRGLQLLAHSGILVYSTCSMNPIENEAVVCRILREFGENVKLIDVRHFVPGLRSDGGLLNWLQSHNPPSEDEIKLFNLDLCIRIYPHHVNSGGFFLACFQKVGAESETKAGPSHKEIPSSYGFERLLSDDNSLMRTLSIFGIENLPKSLIPIRNFDTSGKGLIIRFASQHIESIIAHNKNKLKVLHAGIRGFIKSKYQNREKKEEDMFTEYRCAQEAVPILGPIMSKRQLEIDMATLSTLLDNESIDKDTLPESCHDFIKNSDRGPIVLVAVFRGQREYFSGYIGVRNLQLLVGKDRKNILRLLSK